MEKTLLDHAKEIVHGQRASDYGDVTKSFQTVADFWRVWIRSRHGVDIELDAYDFEQMMVHVKQSRLASNINHYDSRLDIAGYVACGDMIDLKPVDKPVHDHNIIKVPH